MCFSTKRSECPSKAANEPRFVNHHCQPQPRNSAVRVMQQHTVFGGVALRAAVLRRAVSQRACRQRRQAAVPAHEHRYTRLQPPAKGQGTLRSHEPPGAQARPKSGSTSRRACLTRLAATPASGTVVPQAVSPSRPKSKGSLVHIGNQVLTQGCNLPPRSSGHAPAGRSRPSFHSGPCASCRRVPLNATLAR